MMKTKSYEEGGTYEPVAQILCDNRVKFLSATTTCERPTMRLFKELLNVFA